MRVSLSSASITQGIPFENANTAPLYVIHQDQLHHHHVDNRIYRLNVYSQKHVCALTDNGDEIALDPERCDFSILPEKTLPSETTKTLYFVVTKDSENQYVVKASIKINGGGNNQPTGRRTTSGKEKEEGTEKKASRQYQRNSQGKTLSKKDWALFDAGHKKKSLEEFKQLVKKGGHVNIRETPSSNTSVTLLFKVIAWENDLSIIEFLLQEGADPNLKGPSDEWSPIALAFKKRNLALCKLLVEYGLKLDQVDTQKAEFLDTVFISPIWKEGYQWLVEQGAQFKMKDLLNKFSLCTRNFNEEYRKELLSFLSALGLSLDSVDEEGIGLMDRGLKYANLFKEGWSCINFLILGGVKPTDRLFFHALKAMKSEEYQQEKFQYPASAAISIAESGQMNVDEKSESQQSALQALIETSRYFSNPWSVTQTVRLMASLIEQGVYFDARDFCTLVETKDKKERDPFLQILMMMIEKGFDFNAKIAYYFPLDKAVSCREWQLVQALIEKGADHRTISIYRYKYFPENLQPLLFACLAQDKAFLSFVSEIVEDTLTALPSEALHQVKDMTTILEDSLKQSRLLLTLYDKNEETTVLLKEFTKSLAEQLNNSLKLGFDESRMKKAVQKVCTEFESRIQINERAKAKEEEKLYLQQRLLKQAQASELEAKALREDMAEIERRRQEDLKDLKAKMEEEARSRAALERARINAVNNAASALANATNRLGHL